MPNISVYRQPSAASALAQGVVWALGNFDGVHRGHQAVLKEAQTQAKTLGLPWGVMTFWPHPREFFAPQQKPWCLQPIAERLRTFELLEVPHVAILRFNETLSHLSAQDFIEQVLINRWHAKHVVTGENFMFGAKRQGNADFLRGSLAAQQVGYSAVPPVMEEGQPCSSTRLRFALAEGHLDEILAMCGRPWQVQGRVFKGAQRGRTLGFPTANVHMSPHYAWHYGVYAVRARCKGTQTWMPAVASYGTRPQFGGQAVWLEVHVLDVAPETNYYDQMMQVELVEFLRPETTFSSTEALVAQMHEDVAQARKVL